MNILFVHTSSFENCGGIGRVTEINARKFKELGHTISFFILKEGKTNDCFGFKQYFLIDNDYQNRLNSNYFRDTLSDLKIDIIINQSGVNTNSLKFIKEANQSKSKIVTCYHGAIKSIYDNYPIILRGNVTNKYVKKILKLDIVCNLMRHNYKRKMTRDLSYVIHTSDKFVLLAENYSKELSLYSTKFDLKKVTSINNSVKYNSVIPSSKKENRIIYVGRINFSEKRCDLLPIIWEKISQKFPDWTFDIVGDGPKLGELKQIFKSKGLTRVNFHGYADPFTLYNKATILCMTSAIEGYGLVLVEALENNVVPIAFDVSYGVKEALNYGELGVLIPPFDIEKYIEELEKLILDASYRNEFLKNAKLFHSEDKNNLIYQKWIQTFNEISK